MVGCKLVVSQGSHSVGLQGERGDKVNTHTHHLYFSYLIYIYIYIIFNPPLLYSFSIYLDSHLVPLPGSRPPAYVPPLDWLIAVCFGIQGDLGLPGPSGTHGDGSQMGGGILTIYKGAQVTSRRGPAAHVPWGNCTVGERRT